MKKIDEASKKVLNWAFYNTCLIVLLTVPYWFADSDSYLIWGNNWSYFFISLAGIMKAVMDTVNFHFNKSIFNNLNKYFWDMEFSWLNKYEEKNRVDFVRKKWLKFIPVPVMFTDAFHLFQSFHISLIMLAIVSFEPVYGFWVDFIIYSFFYRAFFYVFYKYYLAKK